ncbi:phenylalanine--tRNA ligase subunit alpha [bacterium]|jgi:phenylalanyl-tRNA synthetase alpha chain|nr:phenylalanine--tRNA ligase subunit alpha [bacterium]MBT4121705.1 phenylalanine--tRNA ligase subunit alpha [bacterium]MBT4334928.1 phenylalanine--tRNA ligase subunit alpha [bacterium]MBT4495953.1 phenylalanine--tRNA ligase subunit alpha [bacterium]MBT4764362.1 phenylalanine--tRNA ligase subunit alpha [bacterium]
MLNDLKKLKDDAIREFKKVKESEELRNLETKYLGRKGELTNLLRKVKDLSAQEKPKVGKLANEIKIELAKAVNSVKHELGEAVDSVTGNNIDVTLPGMDFKSGHYHPLTLVQKQLEQIFERMGFMVLEGPELESEHYNFEALNIPDSHPARDTMDTYYIKNKENWVLRTHTSSQQVRAIEKYGAPLRAVFPGRCFRYEATDASHDTTFNQLEGLMIDKDISIANIIAVMKSLLKEVLQKDVKVRMRPGYFPFVEPGFELDVSCLICSGKGCSVCKRTGWVELLPCGLVHPNVLRAGGLDPNEYSGFAFGLGLTRLVMMKYEIDDIRLLLSGDLRFLNQF